MTITMSSQNNILPVFQTSRFQISSCLFFIHHDIHESVDRKDGIVPKTGFNSASALEQLQADPALETEVWLSAADHSSYAQEDTEQSKKMKTGGTKHFWGHEQLNYSFADYNNPQTSLQHHCARTAATLCLQSTWTPSGSSTTPRCIINSTHSAVSLNASSSTTNATDNFIGLYLCNQRRQQHVTWCHRQTHISHTHQMLFRDKRLFRYNT